MSSLIFVHTDLHIGSPIETPTGLMQLLDDSSECPDQTFSIGDNFELRNIRRDRLPQIKHIRDTILNRLPIGNWCDGNHDLRSKENKVLEVSNHHNTKMILVHGDFESWGDERAIKFRSKEEGCGAFKLRLVRPYSDIYHDHFANRTKEEFVERAEALAILLGAKVFICGHKHPKDIQKILSPKGIRIYVLPRGRNVLNLESL